MRQAGHMAAAGLVALDEMPPKLAHDHAKARYLAEKIYEMRSPFFASDPTGVHSNIVMIDLPTQRLPPQAFSSRMFTCPPAERRALGKSTLAKMFPFGVQMARAVLHHGITQEDIELVVQKLQYVARELEYEHSGFSSASSETRRFEAPSTPSEKVVEQQPESVNANSSIPSSDDSQATANGTEDEISQSGKFAR